MISKIYVYAFILIISIGFIKWYSDRQYDAGYSAHKAEIADIKNEAETQGQKDVKTVIKWRTKIKEVEVETIKNIYLTKGNESCLDATYTSLGL